MRGNDLLDKMELIDPAFIEAADKLPEKTKHRFRWGMAAACFLVVLAGSVTVITATGLGTRLIRLFTSQDGSAEEHYGESGFVMGVEVTKFPVSVMKGGIREIPGIIRQQFKEYDPVSSKYPGHWHKTAASRDQAYDYIGFLRLKRIPWNFEEVMTELSVDGNKNGDIQQVQVSSFYRTDGIMMTFMSNIYTENAEGEITYSAFTAENVEYTESVYTTANQKELHVIDSTPMDSGYLGKSGFLSEDGILYVLSISYKEEDAERAETLLHQWADLF